MWDAAAGVRCVHFGTAASAPTLRHGHYMLGQPLHCAVRECNAPCAVGEVCLLLSTLKRKEVVAGGQSYLRGARTVEEVLGVTVQTDLLATIRSLPVAAGWPALPHRGAPCAHLLDVPIAKIHSLR